ncbi:MAG: sulfotransferase family protein [Campylobacterota bacterium]
MRVNKTNMPSYFIIGAPKCGTTALAQYFGEHPDVFMTNPKEPHYFATDFDDSMRATLTLKHYLSLFKSATADQVCGEASVWYMYSNEAVKNIAEFNPDAKIIIMLRNPVDMIHSLHSQKLYSRDEEVEAIEKAWNLAPEREKGNFIPEKCREPKTLYYHKVANYFSQLENVYKYFPKKQVKVILFDDFKKDNLQVYKEVLEFLGILYDGRKEFDKVNENKIEHSKAIGTFFARPPKVLLSLGNQIKQKFGIGSFGIWRKLRNINTTSSRRKVLNKDIRDKIHAHYKDSLIKLSKILDKRLPDEWLS